MCVQVNQRKSTLCYKKKFNKQNTSLQYSESIICDLGKVLAMVLDRVISVPFACQLSSILPHSLHPSEARH